MAQLVSNLSLQPSSSLNTLVMSPASYSTASITQPLETLSAIASNITHMQQQLDRPTDQQSVHHQQLLQQLLYMVQQQNDMLREQAASKEREEQMLWELAESKLREEQVIVKQQETSDRLIVAQQRIEAVLVQNYELHEYPIPRLFVILPDSYETWDPRNFLADRFRLYFLCECGAHCRIDAVTTTSSVSVTNSIHLAKHEGYEISRPKEFFDRYGPYVLGMLRILKHCLAVATIVAPAVALAKNGVKDIMDGVESISENVMEAVDVSIDFLEQKLDGNAKAKDGTNGHTGMQETEEMFRGLAALEGADLRRLDTFLRKKDADKVLGNLYRITTEIGHVKWVCLEHYRQAYCDNAMASFLQTVDTNGGIFDSQCGKVTVSLASSIATKDFFSKLSREAHAVTSLKIALDWSFGSADLAMLVDRIAQSNVRDLDLDLGESGLSFQFISRMRPGKGRYHSLLGLLSNTNLKGITLTNVDHIGPRTSRLPTEHGPTLLQSFHYLTIISSKADFRLAAIISHCHRLVDLRLGSLTWNCEAVPKIDQAIGSLTMLQTLHRYNLNSDSDSPVNPNATPYGAVALRELFDFGLHCYVSTGLLEAAIQRSSPTLEVLILNFRTTSSAVLDLTNLRAGQPSSSLMQAPGRLLFPRLTHLELPTDISAASFDLMESLLPRLSLVHFDVNGQIGGLLAHINLDFLTSICIEGGGNHLWWFFLAVLSSPSCQLDSFEAHLGVVVKRAR